MLTVWWSESNWLMVHTDQSRSDQVRTIYLPATLGTGHTVICVSFLDQHQFIITCNLPPLTLLTCWTWAGPRKTLVTHLITRLLSNCCETFMSLSNENLSQPVTSDSITCKTTLWKRGQIKSLKLLSLFVLWQDADCRQMLISVSGTKTRKLCLIGLIAF